MIEWSEIHDAFCESNERDVCDFIERQRWFGGKGLPISGAALVEKIVLRDDPQLLLALVEVRFSSGTSNIYQLFFEIRHEDVGDADERRLVTSIGQQRIYEASNDPLIAEYVARSGDGGTSIAGKSGDVTFRAIRDIAGSEHRVRTLSGEQSNSCVVLNDRLLLKLYRRLEAGTNPELELLLFLTEHEFLNVPTLAGWYLYEGATLRATLGLAQQFLPDAIDGWMLGLQELDDTPEDFLVRLGRLGEVVGEMHCVLASDATDPDFAPEPISDEMIAMLGARLEVQIDHLPDTMPHGHPERLRSLARTLTKYPASGQLIRTHGDLHLGQTLWATDDWMIIDFEGEPARSLSERRQKSHPLRDVAGMLRSFAYLVGTKQLESGVELPEQWEHEAGQAFLTSYRSRADQIDLLHAEVEAQDRLIRLFELEKILYELDYEIRHRPDWVAVPMAGLTRLLENIPD